jgi:uncharacterized protein YyaL (SSP411 family)
VVAADLGVEPERLRQAVKRGRQVLFEARERRIHPGRDDKMLAEWNGLMLHAFAEAGAALDRPDYVDVARRAARFLIDQMSFRRETEGRLLRLYRTYKDTGHGTAHAVAHLNGYLEDYAAVGLGFVALYQATFELRWLQAAAELAQSILAGFRDDERGGFFQTSSDHEELIARRKDFIDSAVPSGNSLAAELFLGLAKLLDRSEYTAHAEGIIAVMADALGEQPGAFGRLLCALDLYLNPGQEIAIIGAPADAATRGLLSTVYTRFLPNSVLASATPNDAEAIEFVPLLAHRAMLGDKPTAYVCRNYVCSMPVTAADDLAAQLGS